ncbi:protein POOR HOMOLOGOUS SYNAPSIS 1 [Apium graveolens]|uniref:protein POOR HOMOLOGOUS SYNAPSIS 1 n=1 Tax=Apium graveolens TaxID=4045 RepID=UPI003D7A65D5
MAGNCTTSMELAIINKNKTNLNTIRDQYEVEYSRFFNPHTPSSTHPSLTPLKSTRGNWISSSSSDSLVSLRVFAASFDRRSFVLLASLGRKVLEEHYISKLHFTWPQVSCLSGYPARGSRVVFFSYKDSAGQVQKFALRFLSVYETEQFISSLKEILDDSSDAGEPSSNFGSARSPPSECVISSESLYRPTKDWSPLPSASTQSHQISSILNLEAPQISNPLETIYYNPVGATPSNFPPSFTSLLMNCSPAVQQAAGAQPPVIEDADLKDQIARYLGDSSFQDMLMKVQKVFSEIGDDLTIG